MMLLLLMMTVCLRCSATTCRRRRHLPGFHARPRCRRHLALEPLVERTTTALLSALSAALSLSIVLLLPLAAAVLLLLLLRALLSSPVSLAFSAWARAWVLSVSLSGVSGHRHRCCSLYTARSRTQQLSVCASVYMLRLACSPSFSFAAPASRSLSL